MPGRRRLVRVENPAGACGHTGHFTADELKARAVGDAVDGTCPFCGRVHLSEEEIRELEQQKVVRSERYQRIRQQAEE
ncbi:MAG TPA: hypothetical protein ENI89_12175 [Desulfobulbus sp.]|nr:hypothetical protein [Desulfobulbus sp.]